MHTLSRTSPRALVLLLLAGVGTGTLLAFRTPAFVLLLGVAALVSTIVAQRPLLGVALVALLLPFERVGAYEAALGTVRPSQVVAVLTVLAVLIRTLLLRQRRFPSNPLLLPLLVFFAASVLGLTQALNLAYSVQVLLLTFFTVVFSMFVPVVVTRPWHVQLILRALLLGAIVAGSFGLFQFFGDVLGLPPSVTGLREHYTKAVFGFPRVQSTALEPLYFANYLLVPLSVVYARLLIARSAAMLWSTGALVALLGVNLVLTVSRGGYAAAVVVLCTVSLLSLRVLLRPKILAPLLAGGALLIIFLVNVLSYNDDARKNVETFTQHVLNVFSGPSFEERVLTIESARAAFWHSPWVGVGPGGFGPFVAAHPLVRPEGGWPIVNNETLELLAETGLVGFLSIAAALLILIVRSVKTLRTRTHPALRTAHIGLFGALLGVLVQYQTFSTLYLMHVWFLVGLLLAVQTSILSGNHTDG